MIIIWILIYALSILFGYLGIRSLFIVKKWDADWFAFVMVFIPGINVVWGALSFIYAGICYDGSSNFLNGFFVLDKRKDKFKL